MMKIQHGSKLQIVLLFIAAVLLWFSLFIYLPTLPLFLNGKIESLVTVGIILAMYGLAQLVVRIPAGLIADSTGRNKLILVVCFAASGLGALMLYHSGSVPVLMAGRTLTGIGASAWVVMVAVFTSLFPSEKVVSSAALVTIANGLGKALSTFITGFMNEFGGPGTVFYLSAGASAIAIVLLLIIPIKKLEPSKITLSGLVSVFLRREVLLATLAHGTAMIALWAITLSFLPVWARELGAGDVEISLILSLHLAAFTVSNIVNSRLGLHITIQRRIFIASSLFFLGNLGAAFSVTIWMLVVVGIVSGLGFGIIQSSCIGYSISRVKQNQRSSTLGVHQSLYSLGIFVGPWLGGVLAETWDLQRMFMVVAIGSFLVIMLIGWAIDA